ncbi:hypothetical protein [Blastococcus sp. SYSU D01042]
MTSGADWVDSARRLLDAFRPPAGAEASGSGGEHPAHGSDCRWCPVCQTAAVLRGERPEVSAALADVLATTASVLRELAGEPGRPPSPPAASPGTPDDDAGPGPVQRIDIA